MPRLLHVTVLEATGLVQHKEPYVAVELLDITGRPIKSERAKTKVWRKSLWYYTTISSITLLYCCGVVVPCDSDAKRASRLRARLRGARATLRLRYGLQRRPTVALMTTTRRPRERYRRGRATSPPPPQKSETASTIVCGTVLLLGTVVVVVVVVVAAPLV